MRTALILGCVIVFVLRMSLGAGAFYAALRLWPLRSQPFVWRLMVYVTGFVLEAFTSLLLLFFARGVRFTWKFTIVLFLGTFFADSVRALFIVYLIKGPHPITPSGEMSGDLEPEYWKREFREAVREEVAPIIDYLKKRLG